MAATLRSRAPRQLAQWFENYGRHVDQLPTLGVDKEMLEYGAYISQQLHGASMGLKGTTIQKAVDENQARNSAKVYGGALGNISQDNWQQSYVGYYGASMGGSRRGAGSTAARRHFAGR